MNDSGADTALEPLAKNRLVGYFSSGRKVYISRNLFKVRPVCVISLMALGALISASIVLSKQ